MALCFFLLVYFILVGKTAYFSSWKRGWRGTGDMLAFVLCLKLLFPWDARGMKNPFFRAAETALQSLVPPVLLPIPSHSPNISGCGEHQSVPATFWWSISEGTTEKAVFLVIKSAPKPSYRFSGASNFSAVGKPRVSSVDFKAFFTSRSYISIGYPSRLYLCKELVLVWCPLLW